MPRSTRNKTTPGEKPSWMLAAEQRLEAEEQSKKEKKSSHSSTKSTFSSSRANNKYGLSNEKKSSESDKPAWMLAAEKRIEDEAQEKEAKRKNRILKTKTENDQGTSSSSVSPPPQQHQQHQDEKIKNLINEKQSILPTEKELKLLKEILDENKKENLRDKEQEQILKKNEQKDSKNNLKKKEYDDILKIDTTLYEAQVEEELKGSDLREKKLLDLIESTKNRMKASCKLATEKREEYINSRYTVPIFATSIPDSDSDDNDDDASNDLWDIEDSEENISGNKVNVAPKKSYQEMKDDFFQNIDRIQKEVSDARAEHHQTLTSIYKAMSKSKK